MFVPYCEVRVNPFTLSWEPEFIVKIPTVALALNLGHRPLVTVEGITTDVDVAPGTAFPVQLVPVFQSSLEFPVQVWLNTKKGNKRKINPVRPCLAIFRLIKNFISFEKGKMVVVFIIFSIMPFTVGFKI